MCSVPGLSCTDQATAKDRGSDRVRRQSRLHSFFDLGPAHDAQNVRWLRWMDDTGLGHDDH